MSDMAVMRIKQVTRGCGFVRSENVMRYEAVEFSNKKVVVLDDDDLVVYSNREMMLRDMGRRGSAEIEGEMLTGPRKRKRQQ